MGSGYASIVQWAFSVILMVMEIYSIGDSWAISSARRSAPIISSCEAGFSGVTDLITLALPCFIMGENLLLGSSGQNVMSGMIDGFYPSAIASHAAT